jgi:hypothetical protein
MIAEPARFGWSALSYISLTYGISVTCTLVREIYFHQQRRLNFAVKMSIRITRENLI